MQNQIIELEKQWTISGFFAKDIPKGSVVHHNLIMMKRVARFLIDTGPFPFTINYSCDGTTAGTPGDGVDRLDLTNPLILSGLSTTSWIVLDGHGFFDGIQLLIGVRSGFDILYSRKDFYTAGTISSFPTTTIGGNSGNSLLDEGFNYLDVCIFITAEFDCLRFAVDREPVQSNVVTICGIDRIKVYTPTQRDVIVFYSTNNPDITNFQFHGYFYNKYSDSDVREDLLVGQRGLYIGSTSVKMITSDETPGINNSGIFSVQSDNSPTAKFGVFPIMVYKENSNEVGRGYIGSFYDMFFATTYVPSFCKAADSQHFVIGNIMLPWYGDANPVI